MTAVAARGTAQDKPAIDAQVAGDIVRHAARSSLSEISNRRQQGYHPAFHGAHIVRIGHDSANKNNPRRL
jgi:hypothetical protein